MIKHDSEFETSSILYGRK